MEVKKMIRVSDEDHVIPPEMLLRTDDAWLFNTNPLPGSVNLAIFFPTQAGVTVIPDVLKKLEYRLTPAGDDGYGHKLVTAWVKRDDLTGYELTQQMSKTRHMLSNFYRYGLTSISVVGFGLAVLVAVAGWFDRMTTPQPEFTTGEQLMGNWFVPGVITGTTIVVLLACWLPLFFRKERLIADMVMLGKCFEDYQ